MRLLLPWLIVGCGEPDPGAFPDAGDRAGYLEALAALPDDPEAAFSRCDALVRDLRADCIVATVEAAPDHPSALDWCEAVREARRKDECHFQRAERLGSFEECGRAGAYADDCRVHVWSADLRRHWPSELPLQQAVEQTRARMEEIGVDPDDERFWKPAFRQAMSGAHLAGRYARGEPGSARWILRPGAGGIRPPPARADAEPPGTKELDRSVCRTLADPDLVAPCLVAGLEVFRDRIDRVRDAGEADCTGDALPETLRHGEDPELRAILEARWRKEICPGSEPPG